MAQSLQIRNISDHAIICLIEAIRTLERIEGIDEEMTNIKLILQETMIKKLRDHKDEEPKTVPNVQSVTEHMKAIDQELDRVLEALKKMIDHL